MKGLAIDISNTLNEYRSTIHIKKRDVFAASRAAANQSSTNNSTTDKEITNNIDAQDKSDQHNVFRLTKIGVKEGI